MFFCKALFIFCNCWFGPYCSALHQFEIEEQGDSDHEDMERPGPRRGEEITSFKYQIPDF